MSDKTVVAAMIAAITALLAAGFSLYQGVNVANIAARQKTWEVELRRRDERLETYQKAIDLLTDFGWGMATRVTMSNGISPSRSCGRPTEFGSMGAQPPSRPWTRSNQGLPD